MSVGVEVGVGGPGVGIHGLQAGGHAVLRLAGETLLAGLGKLTVGELQSQPEDKDDCDDDEINTV